MRAKETPRWLSTSLFVREYLSTPFAVVMFPLNSIALSFVLTFYLLFYADYVYRGYTNHTHHSIVSTSYFI